MAEFKRIRQRTTNSERIRTGVAQVEPNELVITTDSNELYFKNQQGEFIKVSESNTIFSNVDSLVNSTNNLRLGDVVDLQGYYTAGDGAHHKRKIESADDGSGVQLVNGLWANIVHNGEVNVSWFGAKGDGVTDDSVFLKDKLKKYTTYIFDKTFHFATNLEIPVGTNLVGKKISVEPTGGNSIFTLSRRNTIKIENISICDNYNGYVFEIDSNKKAKIEAENGEHVNEAKLEILVENSKIKCINNTIKKTGYIVKMYCDGYNFGFYGSTFNCITGNSNLEGFLLCELYEKATVRTSWITGHNFTNINFDGFYRYMFTLKNYQNGFFEHFVFDNIQVQCNPEVGDGYGIFYIERAMEFYFKAIKPWDFGEAGAHPPFNFNDCHSFNFDGDQQGSYRYVRGEGNDFKDFNLANKKMPLELFLDISKKTTYRELSELPDGIYSIRDPRCFSSLSSKPFNFGALEIKRNSSILTTIATLYFQTTTAQYYNGLSNAVLVIAHELADNLDNIISDESWFYNCPNYERFKGHMMRIGTYAEKPSVNDVEDGFLWINTNGFKLMYAQGGVYHEIHEDTVQKVLDTPYYATKMQQLGIYEDFITYMDEQHEYEQMQREVEEKRQEAYQLALAENAELTYEEWLSGQAELMPIVEPQPSQALLDFKKKYLG